MTPQSRQTQQQGPLNLRFPVGGLDRKGSFQEQSPATTPTAMNVRPKDVIAGRERGGSRPGLVNAYTRRLGLPNGAPITQMHRFKSVVYNQALGFRVNAQDLVDAGQVDASQIDTYAEARVMLNGRQVTEQDYSNPGYPKASVDTPQGMERCGMEFLFISPPIELKAVILVDVRKMSGTQDAGFCLMTSIKFPESWGEIITDTTNFVKVLDFDLAATTRIQQFEYDASAYFAEGGAFYGAQEGAIYFWLIPKWDYDNTGFSTTDVASGTTTVTLDGSYEEPVTTLDAGDGEGVDLVTNGGFATDTDWDKGTGWTIGSGTATHAAGTASDLEQDSVVEIGDLYKCVYTISGYSAESVTLKCGSGASGTARSANGTYIEYLTAAGDENLYLAADSGFIGSIDDVTVQEVDTSVFVAGHGTDHEIVITGVGTFPIASVVSAGKITVTGDASAASASAMYITGRACSASLLVKADGALLGSTDLLIDETNSVEILAAQTVSGAAYGAGVTALSIDGAQTPFLAAHAGELVVVGGAGQEKFVVAAFTNNTELSVTGDASAAGTDTFYIHVTKAYTRWIDTVKQPIEKDVTIFVSYGKIYYKDHGDTIRDAVPNQEIVLNNNRPIQMADRAGIVYLADFGYYTEKSRGVIVFEGGSYYLKIAVTNLPEFMTLASGAATVTGGDFSGGSTTLTASAAVFSSSWIGLAIVVVDVGGFIINGFTSTTVISVKGDASSANASNCYVWALGLFLTTLKVQLWNALNDSDTPGASEITSIEIVDEVQLVTGDEGVVQDNVKGMGLSDGGAEPVWADEIANKYLDVLKWTKVSGPLASGEYHLDSLVDKDAVYNGTELLLSIDGDKDAANSTGTWKLVTPTHYKIKLASAPNDTNVPYPCGFSFFGAAKKYDFANRSLTFWTATSGKGSVPTGCDLIVRYRDRIVMAGGYVWYMSRQGDPDDWDFTKPETDLQRAVASTNSLAGTMGGEVITAIVPHSDDYLFFGHKSQLWALRGDPAFGGELYNISNTIGILSQGAWCYGPESEIIFLSSQGVHILRPGSEAYPTAASEHVLPDEFRDITPGVGISGVTISMVYDVVFKGVHIFLSQNDGSTSTHYWFDWESKSYWEVQVAQTSSVNCNPYSAILDKSTVLLGCGDGIVRKWDESVATDDGVAISSEVLYGPYQFGNDERETMFVKIKAFFAAGSEGVAWKVLKGKQNEDIFSREGFTPVEFLRGSWDEGQNRDRIVRCRAHSFGLLLSSTGKWAVERLIVMLKRSGESREL